MRSNPSSHKAVRYTFRVAHYSPEIEGNLHHQIRAFEHIFTSKHLILLDGRSGGWLPGPTTWGVCRNLDLYIKMTPDELADVRRLDGG